MRTIRLLTTTLAALSCAALMTLGCSEPETIPGGVQGNKLPDRLSGPQAPPPGNGPQAGQPEGSSKAGPPLGADGAAPEGAVTGEGEAGQPPEGAQDGQPPAEGAAGAPPEGQEAGDDGQPNTVGIFTGDIEDHPCGDGDCDEAEAANPKLCPRDCSDEEPPGGDWCGDGICDGREQFAKNCEKDCGSGE